MKTHSITINGRRFVAGAGEVLLNAALKNGVEVPHECRAGHCGRCCVRLISGTVTGGAGAEAGVVHACQCRISADAAFETLQTSSVRAVDAVLMSLRPLSPEVLEIGIRTDGAFPHHAGQYVQIAFKGYPSRPFSLTLPLRGDKQESHGNALWFHVRRMNEGCVTRALGTRIRKGHRLRVEGPYGAAHYRFGSKGRIICVATNTGFAPIWAIAAAALREDARRALMVIAGGRKLESLYMGPALAQLARFPNVCVVPVCSTPQSASNIVLPGRPTHYMPALLPSDIVYACGAPAMVEAVREIAARGGATCYSDPFQVAGRGSEADSTLRRFGGWLAPPTRRQMQQLSHNLPQTMTRNPSMTEIG